MVCIGRVLEPWTMTCLIFWPMTAHWRGRNGQLVYLTWCWRQPSLKSSKAALTQKHIEGIPLEGYVLKQSQETKRPAIFALDDSKFSASCWCRFWRLWLWLSPGGHHWSSPWATRSWNHNTRSRNLSSHVMAPHCTQWPLRSIVGLVLVIPSFMISQNYEGSYVLRSFGA